MANLKVVLDYPIEDGMSITVKTACDCTAVTGLKVYYQVITETGSTQSSKVFTFKDAHGNDLTGVGNLFVANAYVKFVLDTNNNFAYLQNGDTNKYLEARFDELSDTAPKEHTHPASEITAGTFAGQVVANASGQSPSTYVLRNSKLSATEETPQTNGSICWLYE
jgi:hypothetical protein